MRDKLILSTIIICHLSMSLPASGEDNQDNTISAEHLQLADANADGSLTKEEFKRFVELEAEDDIGMSKRIIRFSAYNRAFGRLDADGNGAVTLQEIIDFRASN